MKCKRCGSELSANTLDRCPNCNPKQAVPTFTKTSRALELGYFILINVLVILGLLFLVYLLIKAWLPT